MTNKFKSHELCSLLYDVKEKGYVEINKYRLWRLLGKGSSAAGTWKSLLDEWEELEGSPKRDELRALELPSGDFVFTALRTEPITKWAGESN